MAMQNASQKSQNHRRRRRRRRVGARSSVGGGTAPSTDRRLSTWKQVTHGT